jgi:cell division transport system permease protein
MSRLFFFIREAFRALRRNGAPSMAAIVTTVVTVVLLGVLIPIFQTTQAKSESVRSSLEFRVPVYDDATKAEIAALQTKLEAIPHVKSVRFITKGEALDEFKGSYGKGKVEESITQLNGYNPLPGNSRSSPTTPPTSNRRGPRSRRPAPTASRSRSRRSSTPKRRPSSSSRGRSRSSR